MIFEKVSSQEKNKIKEKSKKNAKKWKKRKTRKSWKQGRISLAVANACKSLCACPIVPEKVISREGLGGNPFSLITFSATIWQKQNRRNHLEKSARFGMVSYVDVCWCMFCQISPWGKLSNTWCKFFFLDGIGENAKRRFPRSRLGKKFAPCIW